MQAESHIKVLDLFKFVWRNAEESLNPTAMG